MLNDVILLFCLGTLTMNKMVIQEYTPIYAPSETQYTILRYAAMAAKWKGEDLLDWTDYCEIAHYHHQHTRS
jgi:hypothetical protein